MQGMKSLRAIVVLLVSLAVPYSATASMLLTLHCHHDGLGALVDAMAQAAPHCHDGMEARSGTHEAAPATPHHGCDCSVKCQCQHLCATNGVTLAVNVLHSPNFDSRHAADTELPRAFIPAVQRGTPLRPPIDRPSSAA
ncbi:MAG: hypothetical protein ISP90_14100 [Nevskia sp.]|nr:hypothetical protein [Nevskia sp.]